MTAPIASPADATAWKSLFPEPVAVLGYGIEGRSTLNHLLRRGYRDITVLDRHAPAEPLPEGVRGVFGEAYLDGLAPESGIQTAFRAPGVRPLVPAVEAFIARGGRLTSQVEAVFAWLGRERIVGVTGTVGKGTCCSLLSSMLTAAGMPHRLAGNIGVPPLDTLTDFVGERDTLTDFVGERDTLTAFGGERDALPSEALLLLELSSFQLCTLRESPRVAVVLRTTTEHLDWHATRDEYWDHKANLVRYQETGDVVIYFDGAEGSHWIGGQSAGRRVCVHGADAPDTGNADAPHTRAAGGFENTAVAPEDVIRLTAADATWDKHGLRLALADTNMTGAFNLENIAAAAAAALELGAPPAAVRAGARDFTPLEHRIEFVRAHGGVRYFNDSYATRPEAALAAVRAFRAHGESAAAEPVGLILGGSEKNADFSDLARALKDETHLRAIAFIGHTAERLERELRAAGALEGRAHQRCETLEDALGYLRGAIRAGVILLAPACASFGLFANYKERGKAFKKLVNAL